MWRFESRTVLQGGTKSGVDVQRCAHAKTAHVLVARLPPQIVAAKKPIFSPTGDQYDSIQEDLFGSQFDLLAFVGSDCDRHISKQQT